MTSQPNSSHRGGGPSEARVTAVLVSYQSRRTIDSALRALLPSAEAGIAKVVVVDNESSDGTAQYVRDAFPWVKVVEAGGNLGFGRGCNLGFAHVDTPFTLFHNPDAILPRESLETLLEFIEARPEVGVCAPSIREADQSMQTAGMLTTPEGLIRDALGIGGYPEMRKIVPGGEPFRTNWLSGSMLLLRSDVFRRVGGFDPRFFLYFEETDLCRRIAEAGYELWAVGAAQAEHECGASTKLLGAAMVDKCVSDHFYQSRYYYLIKHHGWLAATSTEVGLIPLLAARAVARRLTGRAADGALKERLAGPILQLPARVEGA